MSDYLHECHWGQCLDLLGHLCQYSESILLVSGPEGIGKTAMMQALQKQEAEQYVICDVHATPTLTADHLSMRIEQDFDDVHGKDLLLLIDDAQHLTLDVIAIIFQLKQKLAANGRLHIVLFATPDFEQRLSRSVLKEDFAEQVHIIEVEPLTMLEVEAFLRQQWRKEHKNNDMPFDRSKCKKIYNLSGGIPGKVKQIAEDMMTGNTSKAQGHALSPFTVGVTVSFGILFCILAVFWPAADKDIISKTETTISELPQVAAVTTEPEAVVQVAQLADPIPVEMTEAQIQITPVIPTSNEYEQKIAELEQKIVTLQQQLAQESKALQLAQSKLQKFTAKKLTITKQATIAKSKIKTNHKQGLSFKAHEKHILALPGNYYTLQLLSVNDESKAKQFLAAHNLENKAHYYKGHFKGKDWYIVVYGSYANRTDAQKALEKMPMAIKKLRPMAREYANIHYSINNRGKE